MLPNWTGQTVACIASGPSLTIEDCERVRHLATVVTNTTFRLCPWADALFAFDRKWWTAHLAEVRSTFPGQSFTRLANPPKGVQRIDGFQKYGNSGACAVALAILCGARKVVMIGYDCQLTDGKTHHHGDHPPGFINCASLPRWPAQFQWVATYANRMRAEVVNASRESALTCFRRASLDDVLI